MLEVKELSLAVGELSILNGVSLSIQAGETVGIIGPNGCGKTTLFNCLSGFHKTSAKTIHFRGEDISQLSPYLRARRGLGRVFQSFGIFRNLSVEENILVAFESRDGMFLWNSKKREHLAAARSCLDEFGLAGRAQDKAASLSGGQMRLLEIARAVAHGSELFLLDEPTAGVSPKMKGDVERVLQKLSALGKTVAVIEHDMNFIQNLCSRILVMDQGLVVLEGTPEAVRAHPLLQEIYFGGTVKAH